MQQHISKYSKKYCLMHYGPMIFFAMAVYATNTASSLEKSKVVVAIQVPQNSSHPLSAQKLMAAFQIAIEKVNADPAYLGNYSLEFTYADSDCDAKTSLYAFINQFQKEHISALFGPVCSEAAEVKYFSPFFIDYAGFYPALNLWKEKGFRVGFHLGSLMWMAFWLMVLFKIVAFLMLFKY